MTDVPLFDLPNTPPLRPPAHPRTAEGPVSWHDYKPKFARKCDDCLQLILEAIREDGALPPLARQARFSMKQDKRTVAFVCAEHKQLRQQDL